VQSRSTLESDLLPKRRDLYWDGRWQSPTGGYSDTFNPATGESLGKCAVANAVDVDDAVEAAANAFESWKHTTPARRADLLKEAAKILRQNREELAVIDALNCGNPIQALLSDVDTAAQLIEYFAGLVYELRGSTIPTNTGGLNYTLVEPYGVCARIVAYNHPLMFTASRCAAPLAAGNVVIMKPPTQAPLSAYKLAELIGDLFPAGVFNILTGDQTCGEALVKHPRVPRITVIGSIATGRAIARSAADHLKHASFELGGKNALVIFPDADLRKAIDGAVKGMCFTWCGQACSSTTRLFVHDSVYDTVVKGVASEVEAFRPGLPTASSTSMGALISRTQFDSVQRYIEGAKKEGARLISGGGKPDDPSLQHGFFIEPTVFADVTMDMAVARQEIFGPVLSIIRWTDEEEMFKQVNSLEFGLAAGVYTQSLATAHRAARRFEAGYVWVNNAAKHFFPAPFGGYKQSGVGKEESFEELLSYTQHKNVYVDLD